MSTGAPDRRIWINGDLVPWERATVHLLSHSLQRGSLVFDYLSVHETPRGAALFRLPEHVDRFIESCRLVELPLELGREALCAAAVEAVRANPGCHSVKINAYLPSIEVDVVPQDPRVSVAVAAYDAREDIIERNPGSFRRPETLRLWIEREVRNRRADLVPPQAKVAANYVAPMLAKWRARREGYDDIVLVDENGFVAEGPTTNIFLVDADGGLRTPALERVLWGVTRATVLELAKHRGLAVTETGVRPDELREAREAFSTATTAGVWPIVSIDGDPVGDGTPGPVTLGLRDHFERITSGEDAAFLHWLTFVDEA
ncbi:MAG: aminotransferase class IV [Proteobacteria bacterium]|nr:aminotransferase class IV [Pseudomonadota bacterium]